MGRHNMTSRTYTSFPAGTFTFPDEAEREARKQIEEDMHRFQTERICFDCGADTDGLDPYCDDCLFNHLSKIPKECR